MKRICTLLCLLSISLIVIVIEKIIEGLENDFTKGNDNYPRDLVKAYQLLNDYKHYVPKENLSSSTGVAFTQDSKRNKNKNKNEKILKIHMILQSIVFSVIKRLYCV